MKHYDYVCHDKFLNAQYVISTARGLSKEKM